MLGFPYRLKPAQGRSPSMLWFILLYVWWAVYLCWVEARTPAESDSDSAAWGYSDNVHTLCLLCFYNEPLNRHISLWSGMNTNGSRVHVLWWVRAKQTANRPENKDILCMTKQVCHCPVWVAAHRIKVGACHIGKLDVETWPHQNRVFLMKYLLC